VDNRRSTLGQGARERRERKTLGLPLEGTKGRMEQTLCPPETEGKATRVHLTWTIITRKYISVYDKHKDKAKNPFAGTGKKAEIRKGWKVEGNDMESKTSSKKKGG